MFLPTDLTIPELKRFLKLSVITLQNELSVIVKLVKGGSRRSYALLCMFLRAYGEPWIRYIRDGLKLVFIDDLNDQAPARLNPQSQVPKEDIHVTEVIHAEIQ